jgi:hypothetical protein
MKIFISLASYRDKMLKKTIEDAYNNAVFKDSLVFAVFDQTYSDQALDYSDLPYKQNIRYMRIDPEFSHGCCWARHITQTMYNDEDYYFQVDAHTIFDYAWDQNLISKFEYIRLYHDKPVISGFPHAFGIDQNLNVDKKSPIQPNDLAVISLNLKAKDDLTLENNTLTLLARHRKGTLPCHGYLISGGNVFTVGKVVEEVPYDPYMYFQGEEQSLALRLFTHGYNIFHTSDMPVYHLYGTGARSTRLTHWGDRDSENQRTDKWWVYSNRAKTRLIDLHLRKITGAYGLGSVRTLEQYARFTGIDYANQIIEPRAGTGTHIFELDHKQKVEQYC